MSIIPSAIILYGVYNRQSKLFIDCAQENKKAQNNKHENLEPIGTISSFFTILGRLSTGMSCSWTTFQRVTRYMAKKGTRLPRPQEACQFWNDHVIVASCCWCHVGGRLAGIGFGKTKPKVMTLKVILRFCLPLTDVVDTTGNVVGRERKPLGVFRFAYLF